MKKILLVLNKPNREIPIMELIKHNILELQPDAVVEIHEMCTPEFNRFVLKFRPDVILTFPFTCVGFSIRYYLIKFLFKTKIICFRAEGVIGLNSEYDAKWATGFDSYGPSLVDYELFWGPKMAEIVGDNLSLQNKISSLTRVRGVGYPRLEKYFVAGLELSLSNFPKRIANKIKEYARENILLFITGFHLANYSRQNLFDAKDLDAENNLDKLLEGVKISKRFRKDWIENIISVAKQNPRQLFIVKKHPIERREDYAEFEVRDNILYIYEDINLEDIIPFAGLLLHYGSTALVDSYLSKVPSVYVYTLANKQWYSDLGWPSTEKVMINDLSAIVDKFLTGNIAFEMTLDIKCVMRDFFNIEDGKSYCPSREIAHIILDPQPPQKIQITDPFFWKAVVSGILHPIYRHICALIKKNSITALNTRRENWP